jgi:hypothetical protein
MGCWRRGRWRSLVKSSIDDNSLDNSSLDRTSLARQRPKKPVAAPAWAWARQVRSSARLSAPQASRGKLFEAGDGE